MAIRMTGLNSGLDTEEIVKQLMSAHSIKKTRVENKKTKLEWKQEKWSALNTKITNFYQKFSSKMRLATTYRTKSATSSNENIVKTSAGPSASSGTYSVKVNEMASAQYVTSGVVSKVNGENVTGSTKLSDMGMGTAGTEINVTASGKTVTLVLDAETTVDDFVNKLKEAGVNASFDAGQQRFFISSKESGEDNAFTITANSMSAGQVGATDALKSAFDYANRSSSERGTINSAISTLMNGTDTEKAEALTNLQKLSDEIAKNAATEDVKAAKTKELTDKYLVVSGSGDSETKTMTADGEQRLKEKYSQEEYDKLTEEDKIKALESIITEETTAYMNEESTKTTISDMVEAGFTTADGKTFASTAQRTTELANLTDAVSDAAAAGGQVANSSALSVLGLANVDGSEVKNGENASGMVVVKAQNCEIELNGAILESSSNKLTVNGVTFEAKNKSTETVSVTVENDTSGVYDTIKEFIKEYNTLLKEMNESYFADAAKDYEPLSDEQKEEMSDDEVEKWEKKIKDSLLRRDNSLGTLINNMKAAMSTNVTVDGKNYSLANLGIMTSSDYKEKGLLHIYGDEDDATYAEKEDKLKAMLNDDPETAEAIMTGIFGNLYTTLNKSSQATSIRSTQKFYNDKELTNQMNDYKEEISDWEEKLQKIEDRYYDQFTAMEKALANLNSQQSALAGLLGG